ncbi:hypothetical protein PAXRUDRAFT_141620, partial [Paxillus rubicundulus Ve08.2h10]
LKLTDDEWKRVQLFASLLAHALPALEALHKAWSTHSDSGRYKAFRDGLNAAVDKLAEYYNHTADSDAYTLIVLLDPSQKDLYFKKYWENICLLRFSKVQRN